ncbi:MULTISPECIES: phage portal protein [unclassified Streptomyces]|uniref:phage portal protein n=1 Tax=unclassified Streptomyces TaxID=2593676 RepID=UPI00035DD652|nr:MULTISPECIES: phage portal protein [unclassified Streptomyces]MYY03050.1 phage portal protein [Streptomyces sp. SID4913]
MPVDAQVPESPGWWLQRLGKRMLDERKDSIDDDNEVTPGLTSLRKAAEGKPALPTVPGVDPREIVEWMRDARTNWLSLVIDSPGERLGVDGFRFDDADRDSPDDARVADREANRIWQENSMDADSALVHYGAMSQRRAFVLVEKGDDGRPVLTHETPTQVAVEHEQGNRRKLAAGLKLWRDDWTGNTRATLWTPAEVHEFTTKTSTPAFTGRAAELRGWDALALPNLPDGNRVNELGMVPLVPFINRRNRRPEGFAEHEDVLSIQNRINLSLINLIAAMKYGAFRQRYAAGLEVDEDPLTGAAIQPFQLDIRKLWTTDNPDVRFGEFSATDLGPYVKAVTAAVQDLAAISRTPPHYLIGAVVNVSGDALKAAETGLISKVRDRQRAYGESWENVMRMAFRVLGDDERATTWSAETIWRDPESRTISELADAAVKKASAGVPWRQRMEDMGYTPAQISRMEIDRAADALNAAPTEDPEPASLQGKRDARTLITREEDDVPDAA